MGRIAGPALAPDVLVKPAVAVGNNIETRNLLFAQINGKRIDVLFAKAADDHRIEKRLYSKVFCVPTGTRQRTGDCGRKYLVEAGFEHNLPGLSNWAV